MIVLGTDTSVPMMGSYFNNALSRCTSVQLINCGSCWCFVDNITDYLLSTISNVLELKKISMCFYYLFVSFI